MIGRILDRFVALTASVSLISVAAHDPFLTTAKDDFDRVFATSALLFLVIVPILYLFGFVRSWPSAFWVWVVSTPILSGLALVFFPREPHSTLHTGAALSLVFVAVAAYSVIRVLTTWRTPIVGSETALFAKGSVPAPPARSHRWTAKIPLTERLNSFR